jgi:hypothetical protein
VYRIDPLIRYGLVRQEVPRPLWSSARLNFQKAEFPKWESLKNESGKVACFSSPTNDRQLTSFHQQSTTNSPAKNHVLTPVFAKTPQQKRENALKEKFALFV